MSKLPALPSGSGVLVRQASQECLYVLLSAWSGESLPIEMTEVMTKIYSVQ